MHLTPQKKLEAREFYIAFQRELAVFKEKLPQLLKQFPNEYVAILDGNIVCHMSKWDDLVDLTQKRYPDRFVLLEKVIPETKTVTEMETLEC
jgi:hypothetical protein